VALPMMAMVEIPVGTLEAIYALPPVADMVDVRARKGTRLAAVESREEAMEKAASLLPASTPPAFYLQPELVDDLSRLVVAMLLADVREFPNPQELKVNHSTSVGSRRERTVAWSFPSVPGRPAR
jgi:hypothetical protein